MSLLHLYRHFHLFSLFFIIPFGIVGCSYIFPEKENKRYLSRKFLQGADFPKVSFIADLTTKGDLQFDSYFKSLLKTLNKDAIPPTSSNALRYRAEMDLKTLRKALKNKGYFEGTATYEKSIGEEIHQLQFTVTTGPRYTIEGVSIIIEDLENGKNPQILLLPEKAEKVINIQAGEHVDLDVVLESMLRLQKYFQGKGYYCVEIQEPLGRLDETKRTLTLEYKIILNGKKKIGPIHLSGLKTVSDIFVLNRLHLRSGEFYNAIKIDKAQRELLDTELFSSILITPVTSCDPLEQKRSMQEDLPLEVSLVEAPPRSIGAGVRYATIEGIGGRLYWQHRNLWGAGERLLFKIEATQIQSTLVGTFEKPDFIWTDFTLETKADATKAQTKAFWGEIVGVYLGIKHRYDDHLTYQLGSRYEYSRLKQKKNQISSFVGFPLTLLYDQSNDLLNPYKGWRARAEVTPYVGDIGDHGYMTKLSLFTSSYLRLMRKDQLVLAAWGRFGHILSSQLPQIPLNKRFYSGGANSVRGYGFQKLGPIGPGGRPTGGESQWEAGIEPRIRFAENYGASVFVEVGQVFSSSKPRSAIRRKHPSQGHLARKGEILAGYGVGVKYYTDIGPLRLDIAFPMKVRRHHNKRFDAPFQFYLSIGQAF